jgi:uncharacterized protein YerC
MAKRKYYDVNKDKLKGREDILYKIISEIENKRAAQNFLKDLLTPSESLMLSNRLAIAMMLLGGCTYEKIMKDLQVGASTINGVNKWLYNGFGGYLKELKRKNNNKEFSTSKIPTNEWQAMKKKYPAHFLLFNLVDKLDKK